MAIGINHIISLPLFTGLSRNELEEIVDETAFSWSHIKKGGIIAEEESFCNKLSFIAQGWFEVITQSDDRSYFITETMQAVYAMEPDKIYGLHQRYRSQYIATTPCEILSISKDSLSELISRFVIVKLNYLNMVCRKSQQLEHTLWRSTTDDLADRITQFIRRHSLYPAGKKVLHITMNQLATELNDSRLDISNALNAMADKEKIILKRGLIEIPALQLL